MEKQRKPLIAVGLKFKSKYYACLYTEVLEVNADKNELKVKIVRSSEHYHQEVWNLEHTQFGFSQGTYLVL